MKSAPYLAQSNSVRRVMLTVVAALLPALTVATWFFGIAVWVQVGQAVLACLLFEAAMLRLRGLPLAPFLTDGSAVLTGMLIGVCFPPLGAWWLVWVGSFFAIVVAKQLYGGLGHNVFNPAMVAFAVGIVSFPAQMAGGATVYAPLSNLEQLALIFSHTLPADLGWDALSSATPLNAVKVALSAEVPLPLALFSAGVSGVPNSLVGLAVAYLLGGGVLLWRRVVTWHGPVALILTLSTLASVGWLLSPARFAPPLFHLLTGSVMLGAWFIATDPVTGCTTPRGKLWFGAGVGVLIWAIRSFGSLPDGVAFAVLTLNMMAPLIDRHTQPPVFGCKKKATP